MRLGIDVGTDSIGWCLFDTKNDEITNIIDGGVRIFSSGRDSKSGESLAAVRRQNRSARRLRDRYNRRKKKIINIMVRSGLMPTDKTARKKLEIENPYELRTKCLDERIPVTHFGRALFHMSQRRGFRSNRKADTKADEKETSIINESISRFRRSLKNSGHRTIGEFLYNRQANKPLNEDGTKDDKQTPSVRFRLDFTKKYKTDIEDNDCDVNSFYPERSLVKQEFSQMWESQKKYYPDILTDELREQLHSAIFYQRPLKAGEVGVCTFVNDEPRLPKYHPLTQRRILLQTVNDLRIIKNEESKRKLTLEQRNEVVEEIDKRKHIKNILKMAVKISDISKALKLDDNERISLETENRDDINCDFVWAAMTHPDNFGHKWSSLNYDEQWRIIQDIHNVDELENFEALSQYLQEQHGLDFQRTENIINAPFPVGYSRLGLTATKRIVEHLTNDVITSSEAAKMCGWKHYDTSSNTSLGRLPYYGEILTDSVIPGSGKKSDDDITRYGKISNPTVHIGLNQLRRVVNCIIDEYGKPDQIVMELARDMRLSKTAKEQETKKQNANKKTNDKHDEILHNLNVPQNRTNRLKMRLWEELGKKEDARFCPYSGEPITLDMLFDGVSCEIDHILPAKRTLDDSVSNKTVCLTEMNRQKSNQSPYECWGGETEQWKYIKKNVKKLPKPKRWRFLPDAMDDFKEQNKFLARAITDTQYLSRIGTKYVQTLYKNKSSVWCVRGKMTAHIRRQWNLNSLLSDDNRKNREDHRHHFVDAAVIASIDKKLIKRFVDALKREDNGNPFVSFYDIGYFSKPYENFRDDVNKVLSRIIVSHRGDHSVSKKLHNETAYGIDKNKPDTVVSRKSFMKLKIEEVNGSSNSGQSERIRDTHLQKSLKNAVSGKTAKEFRQALEDFANQSQQYKNIRRVRMETSMKQRIELKDKNNKIYKAYKPDGNHCYELWRLPNGKFKSRIITIFDANKKNLDKKKDKELDPNAKRIFRLHKKDMIALSTDKFRRHPKLQDKFHSYQSAVNGERMIFFVQKFSERGITVAPHNEANTDARNRDKDNDFELLTLSLSNLKDIQPRRVIVNEIGKVIDSGSKI